jgi:nucleoside 2-deoxyribosyltransferase
MERFRLDHPDPNTCAHILVEDKDTDLHGAIVNAIKRTCSLHGIEALLAHEKNYPLLLTENMSYTELVSERKRYAELPPEEREELESLVEEKSEVDLLYDNVLTYILGCAFSIAVIDRQSHEDPDFSIPFLAGYTIAKGKPVCLLKDRNLSTPGNGLFSHAYVEFDSAHPTETISEALENWLDEEDLIG